MPRAAAFNGRDDRDCAVTLPRLRRNPMPMLALGSLPAGSARFAATSRHARLRSSGHGVGIFWFGGNKEEPGQRKAVLPK